MANFYAKAFPQNGGGGGGGGVTSLNSETGALSITAGTGIAVTEPTATSIQIASTSAGDVTIGAFGSTPNANGLSINGSQVLNMQPADATNPGGVSTTAQTIAGQKTFSSAILGADGTNSAPGYSFSSDTDTGLYRLGANDVAIAAGSYAGLEVKKSTGNFANVGMGSAPSASDNYVILTQRDNTSSGTYMQISNPSTSASAKATYQIATDLGANTGEVSVFTAATATHAYAGRMTVRASDSTVGLSLIAGDGASNTIRHYVAGDYTSAGNALEITSQKALNLPQSLASGTATTPASGILLMNDSGTFKTKNSSGTVASLTGTNTGDVTIGAIGSSANANGMTLSGQALNLEPASASFGGVVTTGSQTFAGTKTFANIIDSGLTASQAVVTDGSKQLASLAYASANTASALVQRDGSGNFSAGTITAALSGNATTATTLATARAINGVNFDGSAAITVTAAAGTLTGSTLAAGVTASSLTSTGTLANARATQSLVNTTSTYNSEPFGIGFSSNTGDGFAINDTAANSGATYVNFRKTAGTSIGTITNNGGSAIAYNTSSDYRLKKNVAKMSGALDKIMQLKPVTWNWKDTDTASDGFIAHELQAVFPNCVTGTKDAVDAQGKVIPQMIDHSRLVGALVAALQELKAQFDDYVKKHP